MAKTNKTFADFLKKEKPTEMTTLQVEVNKEIFEEAKKYKGIDGYTWTKIVEAGLLLFIDQCEKDLEVRLKKKGKA